MIQGTVHKDTRHYCIEFCIDKRKCGYFNGSIKLVAINRRYKNNNSNSTTHQREEDHEACDVTQHASQRDLKGAEDFEGRHEKGGPGDAKDVSNGEKDVRDDLWVVWLPLEAGCVVCYGVVWCGVVWYGVVWCVVVWYGVVGCVVMWCSVMWCVEMCFHRFW